MLSAVFPTHCSIILIHLNKDRFAPRADVVLALPRMIWRQIRVFLRLEVGLRVCCWAVGSVDDCIAIG